MATYHRKFTAQTIKGIKPPIEGRDEYYDTSGNRDGAVNHG